MARKITPQQIKESEERLLKLKQDYKEQEQREQIRRDKILITTIRNVFKNVDDNAIIEQLKNIPHSKVIARLVEVENKIANAEKGNTIPKEEYNSLKKERHDLIIKLQ